MAEILRLIPKNHNILGYTKRLFVAGVIFTSLSVIVSRSDESWVGDLFEDPSVNEIRFSVETQNIAYIQNGFDKDGMPYRTITVISENNNLSETVNDKGKFKNLTWSPDGSKVLY